VQALTRVVHDQPVVKLLAYTPKPYDLAVASARTCYSPGLVFAETVTEGQRERIGKSIFEAGHHTPFQHPTFIFGLENVSRQFVWSFLHSHPFYNSEQSSQRYVNLANEARAFVPPLPPHAAEVYEQAVLAAWQAYNEISDLLKADYRRLMTKIGQKKGQSDKKIESEIEKKAIEMARYVLPVGAYTSLYHTISGIELQRYVRMMNTGDTPYENNLVVQAMVEEVRKVDPDFLSRVGDGPIAEERVPEHRVRHHPDGDAFAAEFDRQLAGRTSRLVSYDPQGERLVADSVREVLGLTSEQMTDAEAIDLAVNPAKNPHLLDTLNAWGHSPLTRALNHAQYTFRKKISHTADSQDQRHRTVPGSRPLLTRVHTRRPDFITPPVVHQNPTAHERYVEAMEDLWSAKEELIGMGVSAEFACYLLPNATAIRFTQSGSLLNLMHKWRLRTCFLAQEEIYDASMDELSQVRSVHPNLSRHIGPPCVFRKGLVEEDPLIGPCPEGPRWCGIDVWRNFPNVKRPF